MKTEREHLTEEMEDEYGSNLDGCRSLAICLLIATVIWGVIIYFIAK